MSTPGRERRTRCFGSRIHTSLAACLLILLSAAGAGEDILIEPAEDGVIVRSPIAAANFLFRAPLGFQKADPGEGFAAGLAAEEGGGKARIRLRIADLSATRARAGLDAFVTNHEAEYKEGLGGALGVTGGRGRRLAVIEGKEALRLVLVVFGILARFRVCFRASRNDGNESIRVNTKRGRHFGGVHRGYPAAGS